MLFSANITDWEGKTYPIHFEAANWEEAEAICEINSLTEPAILIEVFDASDSEIFWAAHRPNYVN